MYEMGILEWPIYLDLVVGKKVENQIIKIQTDNDFLPLDIVNTQSFQYHVEDKLST